MEKSTVTWDRIPDEIQREVVSYLDVKSLCFFAITSKCSLKNALLSLLQPQQALLCSPSLNITGGYDNTFLNDASSGLYACGNNNVGQLGLGHQENCNTFTQASPLKGKVLQITASSRHNLILTDQGLFTCGYNYSGELGLGHNHDCHIFTQFTSFIGKILHVATGNLHTLVLTDHGLFACGFNRFGQLGLGHNNKCNTFTQVTSLEGKILHVTAGHSHTLALTEQGLFACGSNEKGELELGHNDSCNTFTLIQHLPARVKARWSLYRHIQHLQAIAKQYEAPENLQPPKRPKLS